MQENKTNELQKVKKGTENKQRKILTVFQCFTLHFSVQ